MCVDRLIDIDMGIHSTPDRYVEIGGAKLNEVSYQLARAYCVPCRGVYVAEPAGSTYHTTTNQHFKYIDSVVNSVSLGWT